MGRVPREKLEEVARENFKKWHKAYEMLASGPEKEEIEQDVEDDYEK